MKQRVVMKSGAVIELSGDSREKFVGSHSFDEDLVDQAIADGYYMPMEDVVLYTVEEIAKVFRVNHVTVRNLIKRGDLYAVKIGRGLRVPKHALDAYFDKIGHPIAPAKPVVEVKEEADTVA